MYKKSYIDPISDYLLHDPEHISDMGAVGRGATTLGGGAIGGGLGYGAMRALDTLPLESWGKPVGIADNAASLAKSKVNVGGKVKATTQGLGDLIAAISKFRGSPKARLGVIGGGILLGGLSGHTAGDDWFKYTDKEKLHNKLDNIEEAVRTNNAQYHIHTSLPARQAEKDTSLFDKMFSKSPKKSKWEQVWDNFKNKLEDTTEPIADQLNEWLED